MALAFPAGPTGGQQYTGPNGVVYQWNSAVGVWTQVNAVQTATAGATAATGAARIPGGNTTARPSAPVTGMMRYNDTTLPASVEFWDSAAWSSVGGAGTAGLGISVTGSIIKVSIPTVATPPVAGALAAQAVDGSLYWDKELGSLFIRYNDGTRVQWVPSTGGTVSSGTLSFPDPATQTPVNTFSPVSTPIASPNGVTYNYNVAKGIWIGGGVPSPATFLEAKTGTLNTVYSSPQTAVPKDASGMTGAAILPSGTTLQQPAIPVTGMLRMNTDYNPDSLEVYAAAEAKWKQIAYVPTPPTLPADLTISASGTYSGVYYVNNLTINSGVTVQLGSQDLVFVCTGDVVINGTINGDGAGPIGGSTGFVSGLTFYSLGPLPGGNIGTNAGFPYTPTASAMGSGGQSAFGVIDGNPGGSTILPGMAGGAGGSVIVTSLKTITVGASASISCKGGNGSGAGSPSGNGNYACTGPGGGSGGLISLRATGSLSVAGTLDVSGGAGGGSAASGGFLPNSWYAGNGGGGGWVILQTPSTLTNTGTVTLSGGAAGTPAFTGSGGGNQYSGGAGGSFAGQGGNVGGAPPGAGNSGILALNGSPL